MPWQKGRSGNPGGRVKVDPELKAIAREYTQDAIGTAVAIMRNPEARDSDRLKAAEILLDRGHGKPRQELEHSGPDGTDLIPPPEIDNRKIALALLNILNGGRGERDESVMPSS
jgi:hypothetical protein